MKNLLLILFFISLLSVSNIHAQEQDKVKEKIKTGWTPGGVPVIAFDSDIGFKYGVLVRLDDYGDGSKYPKYNHSVYLEWSRTTKGSGINQITFDSHTLITGVRTLAEVSLLTEKALDFYGFNGYSAYYNSNFEDKEDSEYISRLFYRMDRVLFKSRIEFVGKLKGDNLKWFAGFEFFNNKLDTVDTPNLNKGKDKEDLLPYIQGGLYQDYINWELISKEQANGGYTGVMKIGAIYDTRDNEANPMKGLWTDLQFLIAPKFIGDGFGYTRIAATHRQYFTLIPKVFNFAYRISYQRKLTGEMPFYMLPLVFNTAPQLTLSGLGGAKTMRGILRNRVVGENFVYGNAELRYKVLRTVVLNQNFYIALAGFTDAGIITGKYELPEPTGPEAADATTWLAKGDEEKLHLSCGAGVHFAINENFIITVDYGMAADKRDGKNGTYIGLNFLF